jgi:hypothetical protein
MTKYGNPHLDLIWCQQHSNGTGWALVAISQGRSIPHLLEIVVPGVASDSAEALTGKKAMPGKPDDGLKT